MFVAHSNLSAGGEEDDAESEEETHYCEETECPLRSMYAHQHVNESLFNDADRAEEFLGAI